MKHRHNVFLSIVMASTILLFVSSALATTFSLDLNVDWSSLSFSGVSISFIGGDTSTSEADGVSHSTAGVSDMSSQSQSSPGISDTFATATPQYISAFAQTTSTLSSHSSFDFPVTEVGINDGYNHPTRPLEDITAHSKATRTVFFQVLAPGTGDDPHALDITFHYSFGETGFIPSELPGVRNNGGGFANLQIDLSGPEFFLPNTGFVRPLGLKTGIVPFRRGEYNVGDIGSFTLGVSTGVSYFEQLIPEPSSFLLLGSGIVGLVLVIWRRRRQQSVGTSEGYPSC